MLMAKYSVTARIEVETINGPAPAEYQIEDMIGNLLYSDEMFCAVTISENKFSSSASQVIKVNAKAERI